MEGKTYLDHFFDNSLCLKQQQVEGYFSGTLLPEELKLVEQHLVACPFCRQALEGLKKHEGQITPAFFHALSLPIFPMIKDQETKGRKWTGLGKGESIPAKKVAEGIPDSLLSRPSYAWVGILGIAFLFGVGFLLFWQFKNNQDKLFLGPTRGVSQPRVASPNVDAQGKGEAPTQEDLLKEKKPIVSTTPETVRDSVMRHERLSPAIANETTPKDSSIAKPDSESQATLTQKSEGSKVIPSPSSRDTERNRKESIRRERQETEVISFVPPANKQQKEEATKTTTEKNVSPLIKEKEEVKATKSTPEIPKAIGHSEDLDVQTGLNLFNKKQYASALMYLKPATENPKHPDYWMATYYSALANIQIGKKAKAKKMLKAVKSSNSSFAPKAKEQLEAW